MCYKGFSNYGMRVLAGFDIDRRIAGAEADGKAVYPMEELAPFVQRTGARIGILAVPASGAQAACDQMVDAGIRGILNFAPAHLLSLIHISLHSSEAFPCKKSPSPRSTPFA